MTRKAKTTQRLHTRTFYDQLDYLHQKKIGYYWMDRIHQYTNCLFHKAMPVT